MTNNRLNGCLYCMAAHTTISQMQKIDQDVVIALRDETQITVPNLQALHVFTARIFEARGHIAPAEVEAFLEAG